MTDQAPEPVHDIDASRTRQARWGRHALVILVVSTALIVIGFTVLHGFFMKPLSDKNGNAAAAPQVAEAFNGPVKPARANDAGGVVGHSPPPSQSEPSASSPSGG